MIQTPQSFVVREECLKAASDNGFRRSMGEDSGWTRHGSTTAQGTIYLAAASDQGPWFLALEHSGTIAELDLPKVDLPGPGQARYAFDTLTGLYWALPRVYALGVSLPDAPYQEFQNKVRDLPQSTEAERLVIQRIGQNIFRDRLMDYWQARCPLTGISDPALLRASHIIPWKKCDGDAERLNIHNGLLLSALWDAAFDRGLVTFGDDGVPQFSASLSEEARAELRWTAALSLTDNHRERLAWHRVNLFE